MKNNENSLASADIIEGRNPILEALKSGREIDKILVTRSNKQGSILKIISDAKKQGIVVQEVDRSKLDSLSQTKNHQGDIAYAAAMSYVSVEDILENAKAKNEQPFIVIADEITDPHNLGSLIRTANAAGVHGIIIPKRRSVGLNSVVAKTSAGAVEFTPVAKVSNIASVIEKLKKENVWIIGADMDGDKTIYTQDFSGPIAIVVGSEGNGISRIVKEKCDFLVQIPMLGEITSLNASVAGALMIYEAVRSRIK